MALEAKYFGLELEPEKRGEGSWDKNAALTQSGLILPSYDQTVPVEFENGGRKRRLRRAGSQIAQEGIWEGILGGVMEPQDDDYHAQSDYQTTTEEQTFVQQKPLGEGNSANATEMEIEPARGLFDGMIFYIWGFTDKKVLSVPSGSTKHQRQILSNAVTNNSGLVFTKPLPGVVNHPSTSFTVVPFKCPLEDAPTGYGGSQLVTEMWVERCIVANTTFDPNDLVMCKPMPGPFPRPCIGQYLTLLTVRLTEYCHLHYRFLWTGSLACGAVDYFTRSGLLQQPHTKKESAAHT
jgi:hypothetical protein